MKYKLSKWDYGLLSEYHQKAKSIHDSVSEIDEFKNSEGELNAGFTVNEKLVFFHKPSECMCIDDNGFIHEIGIYEIEQI